MVFSSRSVIIISECPGSDSLADLGADLGSVLGSVLGTDLEFAQGIDLGTVLAVPAGAYR